MSIAHGICLITQCWFLKRDASNSLINQIGFVSKAEEIHHGNQVFFSLNSTQIPMLHLPVISHGIRGWPLCTAGADLQNLAKFYFHIFWWSPLTLIRIYGLILDLSGVLTSQRQVRDGSCVGPPIGERVETRKPWTSAKHHCCVHSVHAPTAECIWKNFRTYCGSHLVCALPVALNLWLALTVTGLASHVSYDFYYPVLKPCLTNQMGLFLYSFRFSTSCTSKE